ncbi:MAG: C40 family peptidase [Bacteroidales bacterium]|jgi:cell wall-associated NlpC family hydrolase|nr:C40 family peptidase [Bacteroidales bacterium]MCK9498958.1 C40 family peptidase [Bacteroidales bacterium]MDY0313837.1 C40 family peptidase [Bacteroidales bacterium]NLB86179.1 C40 family peptidase [Bacteroidales bacterium]
MRIGICELAYIPLRSGMSHKSEMLNQLLFGELFEILIHKEDWTKVRLFHDDYEGWVDTDCISFIQKENAILENFKNAYILPQQTRISINNSTIFLPNGALLPKNKTEFQINENKYKLAENFEFLTFENKAETIVKFAYDLLNSPYLWGGRTAWGIDCSGLSQFLYSLVGIQLPRNASQQIALGHTRNFITEAKPGDLAFFDDEEGNITHVGIIYETGKIIHASGKVRIDRIDHQGIYNKELKRYTHNLRVVKALL